jgi:outer membrane lipoprotein
MNRPTVHMLLQPLPLFFLVLVSAAAPGCAPVISDQIRTQVDPAIGFEELLGNTAAYTGQVFVLGGHVLETANEREGSRLTILESPLDASGEPGKADHSRGRFMVRTSEFLDPEVYRRDRMVTVGGRLTGTTVQQMGESTYTYPVIEASEIHLWAEEEPRPGPFIYPYPIADPWYSPWRYYPPPRRR